MHTDKPKIIKLVSLIVMAVVVIVIAIGFIQPNPKPGYKCAEPGERRSLFIDKSQGDCNVTVDSLRAVQAWEKGIYGEAKFVINRTLVVVFLLGLAGLITGIVMGKKAKGSKKATDTSTKQ